MHEALIGCCGSADLRVIGGFMPLGQQILEVFKVEPTCAWPRRLRVHSTDYMHAFASARAADVRYDLCE
jgi:hypothetical protein